MQGVKPVLQLQRLRPIAGQARLLERRAQARRDIGSDGNAPHPALYRRELRRPRQLLKSAYAAFFQLPLLPELLLRLGDFRILEKGYRNLGFDETEISRYKDAFRGDYGLTGPLNYYRAAGRRLLRGSPSESQTVEAPTLVIWGMRDPALDARLLDGLDGFVPRLRIERIEEAGHWVHLQHAQRVNDLILDFIRTEPA